MSGTSIIAKFSMSLTALVHARNLKFLSGGPFNKMLSFCVFFLFCFYF